ncbi:MAG: NDP-sugar synthase [Myxococcales bacterium]|nr:NDP-sugar synthase [Myxococcales bacterium]
MQPLLGAILAAGEGTRLRPLSDHLPKPLVPLGGRPLLEHALDALAALGVQRVGINAFHLADAVPRGLAHRPETIDYVFEQTLQGTGGGLRGIAAVLPRGTMVAINGDALFDFDLAPLLARHRARGAMATLVLREVPPDAPFGRVGIDAGGRLQRIAEIDGPEPARAERFGAYTGVQFIEPALLDALPDGPSDVLRSAYRARLAERAPLYGDFAPQGSLWLDVGTPDRYLEAHYALLSGQLTAPHLPPADAQGRRISPAAHIDVGARLIGPCAVLAGARVEAGAQVGPGAFVDQGAVIRGGAIVEACVVWPGAEVTGTQRQTVVLARTYSGS